MNLWKFTLEGLGIKAGAVTLHEHGGPVVEADSADTEVAKLPSNGIAKGIDSLLYGVSLMLELVQFLHLGFKLQLEQFR